MRDVRTAGRNPGHPVLIQSQVLSPVTARAAATSSLLLQSHPELQPHHLFYQSHPELQSKFCCCVISQYTLVASRAVGYYSAATSSLLLQSHPELHPLFCHYIISYSSHIQSCSRHNFVATSYLKFQSHPILQPLFCHYIISSHTKSCSQKHAVVSYQHTLVTAGAAVIIFAATSSLIFQSHPELQLLFCHYSISYTLVTQRAAVKYSVISYQNTLVTSRAAVIMQLHLLIYQSHPDLQPQLFLYLCIILYTQVTARAAATILLLHHILYCIPVTSGSSALVLPLHHLILQSQPELQSKLCCPIISQYTLVTSRAAVIILLLCHLILVTSRSPATTLPLQRL